MDKTAVNYIRKKTAFITLFLGFIAVFSAFVAALPAFGIKLNAAASGSGSGVKIELFFEKNRFTYNDKFIPADTHIIAEELFMRKINGTYAQKKEIMDKSLAAGGTYKNAVLYTMPLLEKTVDEAIKKVNCNPTDSTINFNPDTKPMFKIFREKPGRKVNEEKLYKDIYSALRIAPEVRLKIMSDAVAPSVTATDNIGLTKLRARYSTGYAYSNDNRKHNIKLALQKVNGTVLKPDAEFSFNRAVGRRTEASGFKEAKIIIGGKYENGTGGGVCQVSTTVYNAALLAGLKITDVQSHSLECSYEMPSFDAMVNAYTSDLKFKNTGKMPVFIRAYGTDSSAMVEIYGEELPFVIKRHSETIYRKEPPGSQTIIDYNYEYHKPDAVSGESKTVSFPHGEMKSTGYLFYYDQKGFLIKKEKIREDMYYATEGLVAIAP